jgi:four helix bundle protein
MGSCNELEYDLLLVRDLSFLPDSSYRPLNQQLEEVRRMLTGLIQSIKAGS